MVNICWTRKDYISDLYILYNWGYLSFGEQLNYYLCLESMALVVLLHCFPIMFSRWNGLKQKRKNGLSHYLLAYRVRRIRYHAVLWYLQGVWLLDTCKGEQYGKICQCFKSRPSLKFATSPIPCAIDFNSGCRTRKILSTAHSILKDIFDTDNLLFVESIWLWVPIPAGHILIMKQCLKNILHRRTYTKNPIKTSVGINSFQAL